MKKTMMMKSAVWGARAVTAVAIFATLGRAPVAAATFTVNSNGDQGDATPGNGVCATSGGQCTLRAAIQEANALAGADIINVPALTITVGSTLTVSQSLTINGAGAGSTIIDGGSAVAVLVYAISSGTHTLSGVTIRNAHNAADGGALTNIATLTLNNVTFSNNSANQGGAIFNYAQGNLTLNGVTFTTNSSTTATFGQGGGAVFNGGTLTGTSLTFTGNTSQQGAAFYNNSFGPVTLTEFTISGNTAKYGGGIDNDLGTITLTNGTINSNTSQCCGSGGVATGGGGIYNNAGTMTLTDVTISGNQSTSSGGYGGGIYNYKNMTLSRVSVTGNQATYGAGIYNGNADGAANTMGLTNVTISGNIGLTNPSQAVGAGIFNTSSGQLTITNSTIATNTSGTGRAGGVLNLIGGTGNAVTLRNTILANNIASASSPDCEGTIGSQGSNIVKSTSSCTFSSTTGDQVGVDPHLLTRIGNPAYHPLRLDSPALQAANASFCPATDQRGLARPQASRCDIGAFEIGDTAAVGDVGGNGRADVVWRQVGAGSTGSRVLWQLSGMSVTNVDFLPDVDGNWQLQRLGDFNHDGRKDFLWRDRDTGSTYMWMMNGASVSSQGFTSSQADNTWQIQGVGNFDGLNGDDILWRHSSGALFLWLMDGTTVVSSGFLNPVANTWYVQAIADFDGDGRADILWREVGGSTYIWFMNGSTVSSQGFTSSQADNNWQIEGVGDLDGNGRADILWRYRGPSSDGALYAWFMNGTAVSSVNLLGSVSLDWEVSGVADFDADGKADVFWRDTVSGSTYLWLMNGAVISSQGFTSAQADTGWQFRHPR